jgi:hypothetical protein
MFAVLDLLPAGGIMLANRAIAFRPKNAKQNDLRRVIRCARMHEAALRELWRKTHGEDEGE